MSGARWRETVPNSMKRRRRHEPGPESSTVFYHEHAFQELSVADLHGTIILHVDHLAVPTSDALSTRQLISSSCTKHSNPCSTFYVIHNITHT
jgi:hypothetical protein